MSVVLFLLATIASIISQIPTVVNTSLGDMLKASWLVPFAVSLFDFKSIRIKNIIGFLAFLFVFFLFCMIMESTTGNQYTGADLRNIAICCMVFITSNIVFNNNNSRILLLKLLPPCILILGLVMSVYIFVNYGLLDSLNSSLYVYQAKNSMATILASVVVLALFFFKPNHFIGKVLSISSVVIITVVVMLLRSRATILGLVFAVVYFVFSLENKITKRIALMFLIAVIVAIITIPSLNVVIVDQILFAGRDVADVNELSSGRVVRFPEMIQLIKDSPLIGNGNIYFDCMPLVVVAQYGIIGASIIFVFLIAVFRNLFKKRRLNYVFNTAFVLYCVYLINSIFEAQAPFGPGIKSFILWMLVGFAYVDSTKLINHNDSTE